MPSRAVEPSEMETRSRMLKGTDTTHLFLRSPLHKGRAGPRPEATDPPMSVTDHRSPHPLSVRGTTAKHCAEIRRRSTTTTRSAAPDRVGDCEDAHFGSPGLCAGSRCAHRGSRPRIRYVRRVRTT